jgi:hypothetical protein
MLDGNSQCSDNFLKMDPHNFRIALINITDYFQLKGHESHVCDSCPASLLISLSVEAFFHPLSHCNNYVTSTEMRPSAFIDTEFRNLAETSFDFDYEHKHKRNNSQKAGPLICFFMKVSRH